MDNVDKMFWLMAKSSITVKPIEQTVSNHNPNVIKSYMTFDDWCRNKDTFDKFCDDIKKHILFKMSFEDGKSASAFMNDRFSNRQELIVEVIMEYNNEYVNNVIMFPIKNICSYFDGNAVNFVFVCGDGKYLTRSEDVTKNPLVSPKKFVTNDCKVENDRNESSTKTDENVYEYTYTYKSGEGGHLRENINGVIKNYIIKDGKVVSEKNDEISTTSEDNKQNSDTPTRSTSDCVKELKKTLFAFYE